MRWTAVLCVAVVMAAGCGGGSDDQVATDTTSAAPSDESPTGLPPPEEEPVSMTGDMTLRFFRTDVAEGEEQRASFEVSSPRCSLLEEGLWALTPAKAVVYDKEGKETTFIAGSARFNEKTNTAELSEGVSVQFEDQRVELQDMVWTNETGTAKSDKPVRVTYGETSLTAGSMEYIADTQMLLLNSMAGTVSMSKGESGEGAASATNFSFVDIDKGGFGELENGRLNRISNGVEITLRSTDESVKPMKLAAKEVGFVWPESGEGKPERIELKENVSVDSPQGMITAANAVLNLGAGTLDFDGNVHGTSEQIASFDGERIRFDLESGNSEMTGLRAQGIKLSESGGGYSRMDIDRAGNVTFSNGKVNRMQGGVSISLYPSDPKGKVMKLSAAEVGFGWGGGGQPTSIQLRSNVRVDGPQGIITANRGDLNLAQKQLDFSGNVKGNLPQIKTFDTDKLTYNIESGETMMDNLRANGLSFGSAEEDGGGSGYSSMDILKAPQVSLTGGKVNWMRGGVEIQLHSKEEGSEPVSVTAQTFTFDYPQSSAASPTHVKMDENLVVSGPAGIITSNSGELNWAKSTLTFIGNVATEGDKLPNVNSESLVYDLRTGNIQMGRMRADEIAGAVAPNAAPGAQ